MTELRTPEVLSHEGLGHELGGIGGIYSHVTPAMRQELVDALTDRWLIALDARLAINPRSPVAILDELLRERHEEVAFRPSDTSVMLPSTDRPNRLKSKRPRSLSERS